ncbi:DMT family transporter [Marinobacterium arenosum]|uniref:DMT family transporter n=1 Tax=Marinobacterium arenosum TaxID=2862496 RepID=UPI001C96214F|nr:DMT family transporter [Marinobacterium arenosum]MBY4678524.1 DMT family transporter [Marinobacterium arenosum]
MNGFLYLLTVSIWGTTWIAIKLQLGVVAVEASMLYRFALAALLMVAGISLLRRWHPMSRRDHLFCLAQGACLFCFNFYCFYNATAYISSGMASVLFSMATVSNSLFAWLFYKQRPTLRVLSGSLVGVLGVSAMLWPDLSGDRGSEQLLGVLLGLLGTLLFSLGNMISMRHRRQSLPLPTTNAWGMIYGVTLICGLVLLRGVELSFDPSPSYVWSLFHLAVPGTVVAFAAYLSLVNRIGPDKAAYSTVMFPTVALLISTLYEGYQWTPVAVVGFVLVLLGNLLIFARLPQRRPAVAPA